MVRIIAAPDSFKGSLTAATAAECMARGVKNVLPDAEVLQVPLSDGGEGLVDALLAAAGGTVLTKKVQGPLGEPVEARFGLLKNGVAVIEMAAASGLLLLPEGKSNPLLTTTYGTGELIRAALDLQCRRILLGVGGSATNDGGAGMAQALGYSLLDQAGRELPPGGQFLANLDRIDTGGADRRLRETEFIVACDVTNPLTGENGASRVYGPQKGATPAMAAVLDAALRHLAAIIRRDLGIDVENVPGAGAAGGLGAGLMAFADAKLVPGIELVLDAVNFNGLLDGADLVLTGEGSLDAQSFSGKVPVGVAAQASRRGVPVLAFAGTVNAGRRHLQQVGITAAFSVMDRPLSLVEAMQGAASLLEKTVTEVISLWAHCQG